MAATPGGDPGVGEPGPAESLRTRIDTLERENATLRDALGRSSMGSTSETARTWAPEATPMAARQQVECRQQLDDARRLPDHSSLPIRVLAVEDDSFQQQALEALFQRW